MKRSSFLKSLIGLAAAPEIAKSLPEVANVVPSVSHFGNSAMIARSSTSLFTDLNMVIPEWTTQLMAKYGNDDYLKINQIIGHE